MSNDIEERMIKLRDIWRNEYVDLAEIEHADSERLLQLANFMRGEAYLTLLLENNDLSRHVIECKAKTAHTELKEETSRVIEKVDISTVGFETILKISNMKAGIELLEEFIGLTDEDEIIFTSRTKEETHE